ncbi:Pkinase-domain-containing protein [Ascodesmis nigricans]|uniref:Pkinase-domain-containing protein n=1 Tax=Ascodesmis nigricans TaxID=341454 RepID=A0A4S2N0J5_9PEZI|nr:Pkinase-domain-containing protein [Ascodesmis nigricans]
MPRSWASAASGNASKAAIAGPQLQTPNISGLPTSRPGTPLKENGASDTAFPPLSKYGTAKGGLAQIIAGGSAASSRAPSQAPSRVPTDDERSKTTATPKKKKKTKKAKAGNKAAIVNTSGLEKPDFLLPKAPTAPVKKETQIPRLPSSDEEDWKFLKQRITPHLKSGAPSPPLSGLSSLLSQAHPGDLVSVVDESSTTSDDECPTPTVTYEVAIADEYVAGDAESRPPSRMGRPIPGEHRRKVTSADFEVLKCLGKGAFGSVTLVRHNSTGKLYAQKQFKKASLVIHKRVVEQTKTERAILESVRHPNVVKLYYAFQDHEKLYLILQYAEGGELFHHLAETRMFSEDTTAFYIAQLVLALEHLHHNVGVVYRDLKPENCLLDRQGHLLLTDFGLSKVRTDEERCNSYVGTPQYMAPEVLAADGKTEYGVEVDWWGVGVMTFELLTGDVPFKGNTPQKVETNIQKRAIPLPPYMSRDAKDIITRLLKKNPAQRLGYHGQKDIAVIKKHRFFRKIDWKALENRDMDPPIRPLVTDPELAENFSESFTMLPLSPVTMVSPIARGLPMMQREREKEDPFGGFSFVAGSLLEHHFLEERYPVGGSVC